MTYGSHTAVLLDAFANPDPWYPSIEVATALRAFSNTKEHFM